MIELISIHIPKTAGTAFRHILIEVYGLNGVLEDYPPDRIHPPERPIPPQIKVIHGHFEPSKYRRYFSQAKKVVWLRHPIFRLISEYFFAKTINDRANLIHAQLLENNLNIVEFARIPAMRNFLSRKIEGMNLEEFDFVGIQEFYLQDLRDLKQLLGWKKFQPTIKNSNSYPEYYQCLQEIIGNSDMMNELARLNQQDLKLYQQALTLRAKRRQESVEIQSTLADWQRSQYLLQQMQAQARSDRQELNQIRYWLKQTTQPATAFLQLKLAEKPEIAHLLAGFYIDAPKSAIPTNTHLVNVSGWVIGKQSPARKLIITHNQTILCEAKVNLPRPDVAQVYSLPEAASSGFETKLVVSSIPPQARLQLQVILQNGDRVLIGAIGNVNC